MKSKISYGFTLVEVLIIVGIIFLLAAIAIPNALRARLLANDVMAQATLKSIANAYENYLIVNGDYPSLTSLLVGAAPPYLNEDYFSGQHSGFTFASGNDSYSYTISAVPVDIGRTGTTTYTITTGAILQ